MRFSATQGDSTIEAFNVENEFLGISITKRDGLNMRRCGVELKDISAIESLCDFLIEQIALIKEE